MIEGEIVGGDALRVKLDAMRARTQNLEPALLRSGLVVLKAAADRIDSGGPGWTPNVTGTPLLHQTGRLLSSLTVGGAGDVDDLTSTSIIVGTNVRYATWLQTGTGVFGPSGERITAKGGGPLAFSIGGRKIIVSSIAGAPPRRFLFIDEPVAERVRAVFAKYIFGSDVEEVA